MTDGLRHELFRAGVPLGCGTSLRFDINFVSIVYPKQRARQKLKTRLTLGSYMNVSGTAVNPDRRLRCRLCCAVGQISQELSLPCPGKRRPGAGPADLKPGPQGGLIQRRTQLVEQVVESGLYRVRCKIVLQPSAW